ncbi:MULTISPECIES: penicillin-binding protein 1A [Galbibacter]|uniref:Transglycosylase domain-containing protein n=1 Tax=Galbibacter pacificus TaxID=2996052 RepID=A0ABT6FQM8_9FLAO|nr:transglycosylase domain-containing protein [Galbibacter pacificus]MDG3581955.1 transglycosylase domain-containing protein [Galbibacter pacificus]MDG3585571.1 transglycosylase domain-containing protein [Galbibacter pacificus]
MDKIKAYLKKYKKQLLIALASFFGLIIVFVLSVYLGAWGHIPSEKELSELNLNEATEILSNDGRLIGKLYINDRQPIPFDSIPETLINALVATEDARFYEHNGVDNKSLLRVFFKTILLQDESSGGGSTITQQLAKNLYPRKSLGSLGIIVHKLRESIIAKRLEDVYSKDEILLHYLNTVPFSDNTYGIESASKHFFNKTASHLSIVEAATLVGSLKATYYYNPKLFPKRSMQRRNVVLYQMKNYKYLDEEAYDTLSKDTLKLDIQQYSYNDGMAPYFREHVRLYLKDWLKEYNQKKDTTINIYTDGLKIHTTINYEMQKLAEEAIKEHLSKLQQQFEESYGEKAPWLTNKLLINTALKKTTSYKKLANASLNDAQIMDSLQKEKEIKVFEWDSISKQNLSTVDSLKHYLKYLNCGFVSVNPKNGALQTWVGGIDYEFFKYDHVIQSKRQVGSTFKPFVYTTAIENGLDPCTYFSVEPVSYENLKGWTPENASKDEDEEYMNYSMEYALSNSINTIAVKVLEKAGIKNTILQAQKMGITSALPEVPSLALGTAEVSVMEMAKAYTSYVNNGIPATPFFITKIEDDHGNVLMEHEKPEENEKAISDTTREVMLEMMKATINSGTATRLRGTYGLKNDIAGKTGTTQNNKDAWFVGITPALVSVTWVGLDNHQIGFKTTAMGQGANAALPIFGLWLQKMNKQKELDAITQTTFKTPSKEILESLDCNPEKRDGFFKRLFNNPNKKKSRKFKSKK